jgi:hypothetical protein
MTGKHRPALLYRQMQGEGPGVRPLEVAPQSIKPLAPPFEVLRLQRQQLLSLLQLETFTLEHLPMGGLLLLDAERRPRLLGLPGMPRLRKQRLFVFEGLLPLLEQVAELHKLCRAKTQLFLPLELAGPDPLLIPLELLLTALERATQLVEVRLMKRAALLNVDLQPAKLPFPLFDLGELSLPDLLGLLDHRNEPRLFVLSAGLELKTRRLAAVIPPLTLLNNVRLQMRQLLLQAGAAGRMFLLNLEIEGLLQLRATLGQLGESGLQQGLLLSQLVPLHIKLGAGVVGKLPPLRGEFLTGLIEHGLLRGERCRELVEFRPPRLLLPLQIREVLGPLLALGLELLLRQTQLPPLLIECCRERIDVTFPSVQFHELGPEMLNQISGPLEQLLIRMHALRQTGRFRSVEPVMKPRRTRRRDLLAHGGVLSDAVATVAAADVLNVPLRNRD